MTRPLFDLDAVSLPISELSGDAMADPTIVHSSAHSQWGFANTRLAAEQTAPIQHTFDLVLERELFEPSRTPSRRWRAIAIRFRLEHDPTLTSKNRICLARLTASELPAHWVTNTSGSDPDEPGWSEALDRDDVWRDAFPIVKALRVEGENEYHPFTLWSGAFFCLDRLGVHPLVRGSKLGLALVAHAIWALHRSADDLVVMQPIPIVSWFDRAPAGGLEQIQTDAGRRALFRYYAKIGFKRWRDPKSGRESSLMYRRLVNGLPVRGTGELKSKW